MAQKARSVWYTERILRISNTSVSRRIIHYIAMKLRTNKQRGALLLGLIVLVFAIIVIGLAVYAIYKALSRWKPRQINPDDVAEWKQSVIAEMETNSASILSDGTSIIPLSSASVTQVLVERSTNLINWEVISSVQVNDSFQLINIMSLDTNPPAPQAFYRIKE